MRLRYIHLRKRCNLNAPTLATVLYGFFFNLLHYENRHKSLRNKQDHLALNSISAPLLEDNYFMVIFNAMIQQFTH